MVQGWNTFMMKFGTFYAYSTNEWSGDYAYYAKKVKNLGFDILEISAGDLLKMSEGELNELKALAKTAESTFGAEG